MSFVPSQSLAKLLCAKCKKYLSHFPIYESVQPRGSVCGRCPIEDTAQRNTIYESLAKSQLFPCCYDSNGCTENLLPIDIPRHEKCCYFKKYDCPTSNCTNCMWQGLASQLLDHFETKHPILNLRPDGFEVDFISNYSENCILNFEEETFIVNRTNDLKTKTISYNVSYIGTNMRTHNCLYKVILQSADKSNVNEFTNKLTFKTNIDRDSILLTLNNPNTVITQIEIVKPKDQQEALEKYTEVDTELLRELECTDCFEYMLPPIQQCVTGHSICSKCETKHSECPTCKAEFKDTVNITLGYLIEHLIYPCKNEGCKFTCKALDIRKHEENCIYGLVKCPLSEYENCEVELHYVKIYDHILNSHYENLLEMDTICMPFEFHEDDTDEDCYILRYDFNLFKLHYLYEDDIFGWEMQLIGSQGKDIQYKFEIDVIDNSGNNARGHFRADCGPLTDKSEAFEEDGYSICLEYKQIKRMITDEFSYRVRIISDLE